MCGSTMLAEEEQSQIKMEEVLEAVQNIQLEKNLLQRTTERGRSQYFELWTKKVWSGDF